MKGHTQSDSAANEDEFAGERAFGSRTVARVGLRTASSVEFAVRAVPRVFAPVVALLDRRRRFAVFLSVMAAAILIAALAVHLAWVADFGDRLGVDLRQYTAATFSWLDGGGFYRPWQLAGPYFIPQNEYRIELLPVLYPPSAVVLFVPFAVVPLSAPLWWIIPTTVTAAVVWHWRPAPWTWPALTLSALSVDTVWLAISGNPVMWTTAALALGTVWRWPAVGVLLKPSLGPFALFGITSRSWWVVLGAAILVAVPFGSMWCDYSTALANAIGGGFGYSLNNIPMMLIPLIAWAGRRRNASIVASP